jgi:hypothetical protein
LTPRALAKSLATEGFSVRISIFDFLIFILSISYPNINF